MKSILILRFIKRGSSMAIPPSGINLGGLFGCSTGTNKKCEPTGLYPHEVNRIDKNFDRRSFKIKVKPDPSGPAHIAASKESMKFGSFDLPYLFGENSTEEVRYDLPDTVDFSQVVDGESIRDPSLKVVVGGREWIISDKRERDVRTAVLLGSGSSGKVYKIYDPRDRSIEKALKIFTKDTAGKNRRGKLTEQAFAKLLATPCPVRSNLMCYYGFSENAVVMDLYKENLEEYRQSIVDSTGNDMINWLIVEDALKQLLTALKWLHDAGIGHRDIKLQNVMVRGDEDGNPVFVLADYDLSCFKDEVDPAPKETTLSFGKEIDRFYTCSNQGFVGTPHYVSPELAKYAFDKEKDKSTPFYWGSIKSSDVWALGLTVFWFWKGKLESPFLTSTTRRIWKDSKKLGVLFGGILNLKYQNNIPDLNIGSSLNRNQEVLKDMMYPRLSRRVSVDMAFTRMV